MRLAEECIFLTNFKMILEGEIKDLKLDECYLSPICNIMHMLSNCCNQFILLPQYTVYNIPFSHIYAHVICAL